MRRDRNGIRAGGIFWGVFLICIGVLFLFKNLAALNLDTSFITKFWPLMIVLWGLSVMSLPENLKKVIAAVGGMFTALIIFSFIYKASDFANHDFTFIKDDTTENVSDDGDTTSNNLRTVDTYNSSLTNNAYMVSLDSATRQGEINFKGGGGVFYFGPTAKDLLNSDLKQNSAMHGSNKNIDSLQVINLDLTDDFGLDPDNGNHGSARIYLNEKIPWDVNVNAGLSKIFLDFSNINVRNLNCDAGVAKMTVKIGGKSKDMRMHVNTGITTIHILVPDSIACRIETDGELFIKHFPGFESRGNGIFTTPGYDNATNAVQISLSGGISKFSIARY